MYVMCVFLKDAHVAVSDLIMRWKVEKRNIFDYYSLHNLAGDAGKMYRCIVGILERAAALNSISDYVVSYFSVTHLPT